VYSFQRQLSIVTKCQSAAKKAAKAAKAAKKAFTGGGSGLNRCHMKQNASSSSSSLVSPSLGVAFADQSSKPELSMNKSFTPPNDLSLGQKQIPAVAIDNNDSSNGNGNKNGNNGDDRSSGEPGGGGHSVSSGGHSDQSSPDSGSGKVRERSGTFSAYHYNVFIDDG
jgi:hypothetical protein